MADEDNFWEELAKLGLILGSIWLGSEFLKAFLDKDKKDKGAGGNVNV